MNNTPLRLINYQFVVSQITANPEHNPEGNRAGTITSCETQYAVDTQNNRVIAEVTIKTNNETSENAPYIFHVTAIGVFQPTKEGAEKTPAAMNQSAQLLIGAIRQHILQLTGTMPWGPFFQSFIITDTKKIAD